jgi:hypothetical protein
MIKIGDCSEERDYYCWYILLVGKVISRCIDWERMEDWREIEVINCNIYIEREKLMKHGVTYI